MAHNQPAIRRTAAARWQTARHDDVAEEFGDATNATTPTTTTTTSSSNGGGESGESSWKTARRATLVERQETPASAAAGIGLGFGVARAHLPTDGGAAGPLSPTAISNVRVPRANGSVQVFALERIFATLRRNVRVATRKLRGESHSCFLAHELVDFLTKKYAQHKRRSVHSSLRKHLGNQKHEFFSSSYFSLALSLSSSSL
jgi:hypothetical protein